MYVSRIFGHVSRHEIHKALQFKDPLPRTPVKMYLLVSKSGVAKDWTAGKSLNYGRDHAKRRDEDDIHLRMPEEPEEMLPEEDVTPLCWIEKVRADAPIQGCK